jgi:hypothetical protein
VRVSAFARAHDLGRVMVGILEEPGIGGGPIS